MERKEELEQILNPRYIKFCQSYLQLGNATEAARECGYSESSAKNQGIILFKNPLINEYMGLLKQEMSRTYMQKVEMDAEYLRKAIRPILESNIADYFTCEDGVVLMRDWSQLTREQLSAIKSIKPGKYGYEVVLEGKSWSMDMIAKHLGFYEKDNKQKDAGGPVIAVMLPDNGRGTPNETVDVPHEEI